MRPTTKLWNYPTRRAAFPTKMRNRKVGTRPQGLLDPQTYSFNFHPGIRKPIFNYALPLKSHIWRDTVKCLKGLIEVATAVVWKMRNFDLYFQHLMSGRNGSYSLSPGKVAVENPKLSSSCKIMALLPSMFQPDWINYYHIKNSQYKRVLEMSIKASQSLHYRQTQKKLEERPPQSLQWEHPALHCVS